MPKKKPRATHRGPYRKRKPQPGHRPPLAPRQRDCLTAICGYIAEHGWAPSVRDLCGLMDVSSPNGVMVHLRALEEKGYIVRGEHGESRALRVVT